MAAESVGWLTPQASAAWPECRSRGEVIDPACWIMIQFRAAHLRKKRPEAP